MTSARRLLKVLLLFGGALLCGAAVAQSVPGAPGGLRTVEGDRQLTLHWAAPTSGGAPTSYQYRQRTGATFADGGWRPAGTRTEYVVTGLTNATTYTFQVRATNAQGNGAASGEAGGTPEPPQAKLYWVDVNNKKVHRSNTSGTKVEDIVTGLGDPRGIAVDAAGGKIYWTEIATDKIRRANLDGTGREDLVSGLNTPQGIALDPAGGKMYWADADARKIQRANLDGSSVQDLVDNPSRLQSPIDVALDVVAGRIYWIDTGRRHIWRASMFDGSAATVRRINLATNLRALELDVTAGTAGKMYWTSWSGRSVYRANMNNFLGNIETMNSDPSQGTYGLALDVANNRMYWSNQGDDRIVSAAMTPGATLSVVVTDLPNPVSLALLIKPAKPRDLTAAAGNQRATLSWKAPTPDAGGSAASYEYRHKTAATSYTRWAEAGTETSTVATDLTGGTPYTFQVRARNVIGAGPESNTANATPPPPPDAPTNLTAVPGNRQVMLSWTAPAGTVTGYEARWRPAGGTYEVWTGTAGTATSYTAGDLSNGTSYDFQVRAISDAGPGAASDTVSATPRAIPGAPTNLTATPGNRRVMLSWEAPAGIISSYQVRWRAAGSTTYGDWTPTGGTDISYIVTGLTNGMSYEFQVRGLNVDAPGPESNTATATLPTAPNLTAAPGNTRVMLSWTMPAGTITGYQVRWRRAAGSTTYGGWTPTGSTETSHTVTELANGTGYDFQVRTVNNLVFGPQSNTASATPQPPPGAPTNLTASPGNGWVVLSWTAPPETITGYQVRWRATGATTYGDWTPTGRTDPSHAVTGLTNGTRYDLQVRGLNGGVPGAQSNTATATPRQPPGAPLNLMTTPGNGQVMLSWGMPTGTVTGYEARWRPAGGAYEIWTAIGTATSYTVAGLTNGTRYEFQVQAVNSGIPGPVADTVSATPQVPPGAPTNPAATSGNRRVTLSWTAPTGTVTGYQVRWRATGGTYGNWMPTGGTDPSHIVTGLTDGTRYEFQVRALNGEVPGPESDMVSAMPQSPPGVPGGLRTVEGDRQLTLHWAAPTNGGSAASYEYRQRAGATFVDGWQPAGTGTEHVVTGLINATTYTFQVRAANRLGNSAASGEAGGTPEPPRAKLYWVDGGTGKVQRANTSGTKVEDIITGLRDPRGIAMDAAGGKIYWTDITEDKIHRANLDGTGREDLVTGVDIPQDIALDVAAGKMYWVDDGANKIQRANLDGSGREDLVTGLSAPLGIALDVAAGRMYWVDATLRRIQRANMSDGSSLQSIRTGLPAALRAIRLDVAAGKMYWASWTAGTIYRADMSSLGGIENMNSDPSQGTNGLALDVANNRMYWSNPLTDRIVSAAMTPGATQSVLVTSIPSPLKVALLLKPGKPRELTAAPGGARATLSWKAPAPDAGGSAASYEYRHKTAATSYTRWVGAGTGTSTMVPNLTNGVTYTFELRAGNVIGFGPESNTTSTTPRQPPSAPAALTATPGEGQVMLSWMIPAGAVTGYEVRWRPSGGTWNNWTAVGTNTSHTVPNLTDDRSYEFQVRALNSRVPGPISTVTIGELKLRLRIFLEGPLR